MLYSRPFDGGSVYLPEQVGNKLKPDVVLSMSKAVTPNASRLGDGNLELLALLSSVQSSPQCELGILQYPHFPSLPAVLCRVRGKCRRGPAADSRPNRALTLLHGTLSRAGELPDGRVANRSSLLAACLEQGRK